MFNLENMIGGKVSKIRESNFTSAFNMLKRLFGENWYEILIKKSDYAIKRMEQEYDNLNTLKTYFTRIVVILKEQKNKKINEKILDKYIDKMKEYTNLSDDRTKKNVKSEREKKNMISWNKVLEAREKLKKIANNKNNLQSFQNYLIASLYTYQPPVRADYADMLIIDHYNPKTMLRTKADKKKKIKGNEILDNFLVLDDEKPFFLFNNYKTFNLKKYNPVIIEINPKLYDIILDWLDDFNTEAKYLLIQNNNEPMSPGFLSKKVTRIFKSVTGKEISINTLRHIFITDVINNKKLTYEAREHYAHMMMHNVDRQLKYVKYGGSIKNIIKINNEIFDDFEGEEHII